jgi:dipeptidyl aminopeptidase/acylaminoacyl peptidase
MARRLAALLFCLLALPSAAGADTDYGRIAYVTNRDGNEEIYVCNRDGSGLSRLTRHWAIDTSPAWSPDGSQISFVSEQGGAFDILAMNEDGTGVRNLTNNHALEFVFPRWSPDGRQLMVTVSGHSPLANAFQVEDLGVAGVILQSVLLMGTVLILVTGWTLPLGALTVMFTLNGLLLSVFGDRYVLVAAMLAAGTLSDFLLWWIKPSIERRRRFYLFAISVPVLLYALYFLALQLTQGIEWSIQLSLGALFMAGLAGWLVSFLFVSPLRQKR